MFAQNFPLDTTGKITYQGIVKVDSLSAKEIYTNAKSFIANQFKSYKDVVQLEDETNYKFIIKGSFVAIYEGEHDAELGVVKFKATIECKDNRYRYTITNFTHEYQRSGYDLSIGNLESNEENKLSQEAIQGIKIYTNKMMLTIIEKMKTDFSKKNNDNW
jgi:hypothetical protein